MYDELEDVALDALVSPEAPDWGRQAGIYSLWTEIKDGLWVGGTKDEDTVAKARRSGLSWQVVEDAEIGPNQFKSVVTLYAWARPADWLVEEYRWGIYDSASDPVDMGDLRDTVVWAHKRWKSGKRTLIRCQAGLSRSPFVTALILVRDGMAPQEATDLIRSKRSRHCLNLNGSRKGGTFSNILYNTDPGFWRD